MPQWSRPGDFQLVFRANIAQGGAPLHSSVAKVDLGDRGAWMPAFPAATGHPRLQRWMQGQTAAAA